MVNPGSPQGLMDGAITHLLTRPGSTRNGVNQQAIGVQNATRGKKVK